MREACRRNGIWAAVVIMMATTGVGLAAPATLLEVLEVGARGTIENSETVLESGKTYYILAEGTYRHGSWPGGVSMADAEWAHDSDYVWYEDYLPDTENHDLLINGQEVDWMGSALEDPDPVLYHLTYAPHVFSDGHHSYWCEFVGEGAPVSFRIFDTVSYDNQGSLTVSIYSGTPAPTTLTPVEKVYMSIAPEPGAEYDIFCMNPDGTEMVNLTATLDTDALDPRISPDGRRIAFSTPDGIWVMQADGRGKRQVTTEGGWRTWFGSQALVYVVSTTPCVGEARFVNIDDWGDPLNGEVIVPSGLLGDNNLKHPALSPDGQWLVFANDEGCWAPTMDIQLVDMACALSNSPAPDSCAENLYADPGDNYEDGRPVWSHNNILVYWQHHLDPGLGQNRVIASESVYSLGGDDDYRLVRPNDVDGVLFHNLVAAAPAGEERLLFKDSENDLYIWNTSAGTDTLVLADGVINYGDWGYVLLPKVYHERIVVSAQDPDDATYDVLSMNVDGSGVENLTSAFEADAYDPCLSPDGSRIAFLTPDGIWVMNADGSGKRQVTTEYGWRDWADDHSLIYVVSEPSCSGEARFVNIDDPTDPMNGTVIVPSGILGDNNLKHPSISPDGQWLALANDAACWAPTMDIQLIDLDCAFASPPADDSCGIRFYNDSGDNYEDGRPLFDGTGETLFWQHHMSPGLGQNRVIVAKDLDSTAGENAWDRLVRQNNVDGVVFQNLVAIAPTGEERVLFKDSANDLYMWNTVTGTDTLVLGGGAVDYGDWAHVRYAGDVNCDGVVDFADINPFVLALGGAGAYEQEHLFCTWYNADVNGDGVVDFADINPFIAVLSE